MKKENEQKPEKRKNNWEKSLSEYFQNSINNWMNYTEGERPLFIVEPPQNQRYESKYINGSD